MGAKFKAIRTKSTHEFDRLLEHLTHEAYRARSDWDIWVAIDKSLSEFSAELNETPAFWVMTQRAYKESVLLRLVRLYDPDPTATSIGNLLQTMKQHRSLVSAAVPGSIANLSAAELDADLVRVSSETHTVEKLLRIRNEYLAHRGTKHIVKGTYASLPKLSGDEISSLMEGAISILCKYNERLERPELLWGRREAAEFQQLLLLVRAGLQPAASRNAESDGGAAAPADQLLRIAALRP